jgi:hypothetical protein
MWWSALPVSPLQVRSAPKKKHAMRFESCDVFGVPWSR